MDIIPNVVESWQLVPNEPNIWDLQIRSNIHFQDGSSLDAKAVKYSIEQAAYHWKPNFVVGVAIKALHRLYVVTDGSNGTLPNRLCDVYIVPEGYYDESDKSALMQKFYYQPVGSGEYRLVQHVPGSHIVLERFEGYHGKKPVVRKLIYRIIPKNDQPAAKGRGDIDITDDPPNLEFFGELKRLGIRAVEGLGPIVFVGLNAQGLPDPRVRTALSLALDRSTIARQQGGIVSDLIFAPEAPASPKEPVRWYEQNIPRARELLTEANFSRIVTITTYGDLAATADMVASQWQAVGISSEIVLMEFPNFLNLLENKKLPDAYVIRRSTQLWDPDLILSQHVASGGQYSTYTNAEVDKYILQGRSEVIPERRAATYQQLLPILKDNPPFIPLFREQRFHGISENIVWKPRPDGRILGRDIELER